MRLAIPPARLDGAWKLEERDAIVATPCEASFYEFWLLLSVRLGMIEDRRSRVNFEVGLIVHAELRGTQYEDDAEILCHSTRYF